MKYLLLSLIVLLASCATTKKSVEQMKTETKIHQSETLREQAVERVVDTTKTTNGKVTITDIDFYIGELDTAKNDVPNVELCGIGTFKGGNVKHIKQTIIEASTTQRGESKESEQQKDEVKQAVSTYANKSSIVQSEPAPDPKKWQYIFYIMIVGILVLLYFKRQPIFNWIKKLLSGIRLIF